MAVLGLSKHDRMIEYNCIDLLPDLEDDVLSCDVIIPAIEESFSMGLDDWWPSFVADMCL
ncbi:MAG: hypothetical protein LBE65_01765 [Synergistaceae bacterium]|jgi:uncharacterized radical SAM superfamily protein|nr:hypothetical protein [Synergistaceae bacterium]